MSSGSSSSKNEGIAFGLHFSLENVNVPVFLMNSVGTAMPFGVPSSSRSGSSQLSFCNVSHRFAYWVQPLMMCLQVWSGSPHWQLVSSPGRNWCWVIVNLICAWAHGKSRGPYEQGVRGRWEESTPLAKPIGVRKKGVSSGSEARGQWVKSEV